MQTFPKTIKSTGSGPEPDDRRCRFRQRRRSSGRIKTAERKRRQSPPPPILLASSLVEVSAQISVGSAEFQAFFFGPTASQHRFLRRPKKSLFGSVMGQTMASMPSSHVQRRQQVASASLGRGQQQQTTTTSPNLLVLLTIFLCSESAVCQPGLPESAARAAKTNKRARFDE